jgi:hypothetical protein
LCLDLGRKQGRIVRIRRCFVESDAGIAHGLQALL